VRGVKVGRGRTKSTDNDTNFLGELKDLKNVHIVDASTFPDIPATTFGLLCIINSKRITDQSLNFKNKI
jgi:hypothetical protein